jgi:hypothetical protein
MNNKPYAWINVNDEYKILFDDELPNAYPTAWIPLYTHPIKKLTNDDAEQAFKEWEKTETFAISNVEYHGFINGFKCALKKAELS